MRIQIFYQNHSVVLNVLARHHNFVFPQVSGNKSEIIEWPKKSLPNMTKFESLHLFRLNPESFSGLECLYREWQFLPHIRNISSKGTKYILITTTVDFC